VREELEAVTAPSENLAARITLRLARSQRASMTMSRTGANFEVRT
jgi:hypothetical protein